MDIFEGHPDLFGFVRTFEGSKALVLLNFREEEQKFNLDYICEGQLELALSNYEPLEIHKLSTGSTITLRSYEGRLYLSL